MEDKTPSYHMTFEAVSPVGRLSTMGPFLNADVTNPRELYSILSDTRHQGGTVVASSVIASTQQTALKLPPLQSSSASEAQLRPLGEQPQHSSYPDLTSLGRQDLGSRPQLDSVRRSTSLQDVNSLDKIDGLLTSKKLTPIQRPGDPKSPREVQEKREVRSGRTEDQLVKDQPLPPIEGKGDWADHKGGLSSHTNAGRLTIGDDLKFDSPPSHRRSPECPRYIFPRGQPVKVKKPLTPTYDDYPEAYWELRSPTLQVPSDLKEDMIDRDNYRLQQISLLHLRAMNRDGVTTSRLDAYRKWQQNIQEHLPPLGLSNKLNSPRIAGIPSGPIGQIIKEKSKFKVSVPVQSHTLLLAPTPLGHTAAKKQNDGMHTTKTDSAEQVTVPAADAEPQQETPHENGGEQEPLQQQEKSRTNGAEKDTQKLTNGAEKDTHKLKDAKPLKASVVNLYMTPAASTTKVTTELPLGLKRTLSERRSRSGKPGPQPSEQYPHLVPYHPNIQVLDPPRNLSASSKESTRSSSLTHYFQRIPSAPVGATPPHTLRTLLATNRPRPKPVAETSCKKNAGGKLILNKFNRLQVFGEQSHQLEDSSNAMGDTSCYAMDVRAQRRKPYLPENRPPTYRLDMRNYPPRHHAYGRGMGVNVVGGGYPILISERGGMPMAEHVDPASLSFRFRDGEVIVSRQGKKTHLT
ncbi:hypothetical protein ACOMHN_029744 [Nucella lapillus]